MHISAGAVCTAMPLAHNAVHCHNFAFFLKWSASNEMHMLLYYTEMSNRYMVVESVIIVSVSVIEW